MEALHKDDEDGDHRNKGGMMVEFTVETWRWDHYDSKCHTIHNLIWSYICLWCLLSSLTILIVFYMWWMFCHYKIAFLRKDEILMPFINSCNYRILIIVGWVCQRKVPSSIITNSECRAITSIVLAYSWKLSKRFWALWHEVGSWGIGCQPTNKSHIGIWLTTVVYLCH
jgi:hypothetical protein